MNDVLTRSLNAAVYHLREARRVLNDMGKPHQAGQIEAARVLAEGMQHLARRWDVEVVRKAPEQTEDLGGTENGEGPRRK